MKNIIYSLLLLFLFSGINLYAQEVVEEDYIYEEEIVVEEEASTTTAGQLPTKPFTHKDYKHWSLSIDGGLNMPFTDMVATPKHVFNHIGKHWSLGANVEYTINPMFSVGLSYMYSMTSMSENAGSFESSIHHIYPFVGVNLLNYPLFNRNKKWDLWFTAGVGVHHMNSLVNYPYRSGYFYNGAPVTEDIWNDPENGVGAERTKDWNGVIPLGMELSYNITREVSIALKYTHFMYTHDYLEGAVKHQEYGDKYGRKRYAYTGASNDHMANLLLSVRWDITGKNNTHMRKVSWQEFKANKPEKQKPAEKDTIVIIQEVPAVVAPVVASSECTCQELPVSVYFDFDKYNFTPEALLIISKVAQKMMNDEDLKVELVAYADPDGTDAYNDVLSQRRADAVKNELVKIWGISADRIDADGKGILKAPNRNYHHVSRRCDFIFSK